MSILMRLPHIMEEGKKQWEEMLKRPKAEFSLWEEHFLGGESKGAEGVIANGDNLHYMASLLGNGTKLDLIYIDPPFFSEADYGNEIKLKADGESKPHFIKKNAYKDTWEDGLEGYLKMMIPRLFMMKELLRDTGTIWVHLDWHAAHYMKIILDEIFGGGNFINEVIWNYKSGGSSKKRFGRKHDTLLFYGKSKNYYFKPQQEKSYNRGMKPYRFKGVEEFQDQLGWYTMVNMKDVWQLDMVGRTAAERTGYATQKPESLIGRILESCTKEGDTCADFFAGSGTLAATAQKMNRNWITCDIGALSTLNTVKRIVKNRGDFKLFQEKTETSGKSQDELSLQDGNGGELKVTVDIQDNQGSGREKQAVVTLISYNIKEMKNLSIDEKNIEQVDTILKNDSLQLVEYWSVDFQYDGVNFRPQASFIKEKDSIPISCQQLGGTFDKIGIRGMDVFGNWFLAVMDVENKKLI